MRTVGLFSGECLGAPEREEEVPCGASRAQAVTDHSPGMLAMDAEMVRNDQIRNGVHTQADPQETLFFEASPTEPG